MIVNNDKYSKFYHTIHLDLTLFKNYFKILSIHMEAYSHTLYFVITPTIMLYFKERSFGDYHLLRQIREMLFREQIKDL